MIKIRKFRFKIIALYLITNILTGSHDILSLYPCILPIDMQHDN